MAAKKRKRLVYLVASYPELRATTLEDDLRSAFQRLTLVSDRKIEIANKTWVGLNYRDRPGAFTFQFSLSVPGEAASTLPTGNLDVNTVEMNTTQAPQGHDFSDGDLICLVHDNQIFTCTSSIRDNTLTPYLRALFEKAELPPLASQVIITKPGNLDKMRLIRDGGVKSIDLSVTLGGVDFARLEDIEGESFLRKTWRALSREAPNLARCAQMAKTRFCISFGKSRETGADDLNWLNAEAEAILEGGHDNYKIQTKDGKTITQSEIIISKFANMEPFGKSVFLEEALHYLEVFKNEMLQPHRE